MKYTRINFGIAACVAAFSLAACNDTPTHARGCSSPDTCDASANGVLGGGGGRTDTIPQPSSMGDSTGVLGGGGGH